LIACIHSATTFSSILLIPWWQFDKDGGCGIAKSIAWNRSERYWWNNDRAFKLHNVAHLIMNIILE
jgi:hypothetical protein